jgi:hypothetical protein
MVDVGESRKTGVQLHGWNELSNASYILSCNPDGALSVQNQTYTQAIAEGDIAGHASWSKIGFTSGLIANAESDVWSRGSSYIYPTTGQVMKIISTANSDRGVTFLSSVGVVTSGGTATSLSYASGTGVAVGDCVVLDKAAVVPEWGYVTAVLSGNVIAVSGGFSEGGSANSRTYQIVDVSATSGVQVIKIDYLDSDYAEKVELVVTEGSGYATTVGSDLFRVNSFRAVAAGVTNAAQGNISIGSSGLVNTYSYINAGYTRARNCAYTVPAGKTVYVTGVMMSFGYTASNAIHYCRIYTRANREPSTGMLTGSIFYPYSEVVVTNSMAYTELTTPTRLMAKTDIKVSAVASVAGLATVALRGWIE